MLSESPREFHAANSGSDSNPYVGSAPRIKSPKKESAEHPSGIDVNPCQKGNNRKTPRDSAFRQWA